MILRHMNRRDALKSAIVRVVSIWTLVYGLRVDTSKFRDSMQRAKRIADLVNRGTVGCNDMRRSKHWVSSGPWYQHVNEWRRQYVCMETGERKIWKEIA